MIYFQLLANGVVLGGLYACIAVGFSLVWGVLNVINILHGSFIVLGSYIAYFSYTQAGIHPLFSIVTAGGLLFSLRGFFLGGFFYPGSAAPVFFTLTLTFGLGPLFYKPITLAVS